MLHIDEIRERLRNHPEPPEVTAIRENILSTFNKLRFVEEGHQYFLPNKDGGEDELISVSKLTEQFAYPTDWDAVALNKAQREGVDVNWLKRQWKENNIRATNSGTGVHLFGENFQYFFMGQPEKICDIIKPQYEDGFLIPHSPKEAAAAKLYEDMFTVDNLYPVLAETRVYMGVNDKFPIHQKYAGTFDMLFAYRSKSGEYRLAVYDFKSNASLYNDFARGTGKMMLPPFDYLYDEPLGHYTLQLSAYELCLRQIGYTIGDRKLIWLKDDATYEKISLPSVSDKLAEIL